MVINIKKFYRREITEAMFFGYVNAFRINFPGVKLDSAILKFIEDHGIKEETSLETMRTTYYRMEKEYMEVKDGQEK